ncbi:hypothetical protein Q2B95_08185 [Stenotrophomonas maltophilia]|uniref:hypothetical protein n=1 Tax=Stenotrophomonas maltophilia TaxID=40324 RepID=UPI0030A3E49D
MFITLAALAILVLRVRYPEVVKIDAISIALIIVAVLPWLRSIVKSVEVAGLGKLELQDVERAARKVEDAGLPKRGAADGEAAGTPEMEPGNGPGAGVEPQEPSPEPTPATADPVAPPETGAGRVEKDALAAADPAGSSPDRNVWWQSLSLPDYHRHTKGLQGTSYAILNRLGASLLRDSGILTPDTAYTLLDGALAELADEYGLKSDSRSASVKMLKFLSVIDEKQADAVLTAFDLLSAARHGVTSRLAENRAVDVALEVVDSLKVLRTRAIERKKRSERIRGVSKGAQGGDAANADATDSDTSTNRTLLDQKMQLKPGEGEG